MERELMQMGVIRGDLEELASISEPKGYEQSRPATKAWHESLIVNGKVMF